jgi:hypothetical protein
MNYGSDDWNGERLKIQDDVSLNFALEAIESANPFKPSQPEIFFHLSAISPTVSPQQPTTDGLTPLVPHGLKKGLFVINYICAKDQNLIRCALRHPGFITERGKF